MLFLKSFQESTCTVSAPHNSPHVPAHKDQWVSCREVWGTGWLEALCPSGHGWSQPQTLLCCPLCSESHLSPPNIVCVCAYVCVHVCVCVHAAFQVLWGNSVMCAIVSYTSQKQKGCNLGYPNYILILIQWSVWSYKFFAARTRQDKARCQTNQHQEPSHLLMYQWHWPVRLVQWYLQLLSLDAKVLRNIYWYTALNGSGVH